MNENDDRLINLAPTLYAVRFPYAQVTERTMVMAVPSLFRRNLLKEKKQIRFAPETEATAGELRADCELMAITFPAALKVLIETGAKLSDYVLFRIQPI